MNWMASVVNRNLERLKMNADPVSFCSDGFILNLGVTLLRLSQPFMDTKGNNAKYFLSQSRVIYVLAISLTRPLEKQIEYWINYLRIKVDFRLKSFKFIIVGTKLDQVLPVKTLDELVAQKRFFVMKIMMFMMQEKWKN